MGMIINLSNSKKLIITFQACEYKSSSESKPSYFKRSNKASTRLKSEVKKYCLIVRKNNFSFDIKLNNTSKVKNILFDGMISWKIANANHKWLQKKMGTT